MPEEAGLDTWADVQLAAEQRALEREKWERTRQEREDTRRHERREKLLDGIGIVSGVAIVCGTVGFLLWLWWQSAQNNGDRSVIKAEQRTAQVEACTSLEQPLERQYCLLALNIEPAENDE